MLKDPIGPVGVRLREPRLANHLTQRELADAAGVSPEAVHTIERGRKLPRRDTARLLAHALGAPPELLDYRTKCTLTAPVALSAAVRNASGAAANAKWCVTSRSTGAFPEAISSIATSKSWRPSIVP